MGASILASDVRERTKNVRDRFDRHCSRGGEGILREFRARFGVAGGKSSLVRTVDGRTERGEDDSEQDGKHHHEQQLVNLTSIESVVISDGRSKTVGGVARINRAARRH